MKIFRFAVIAASLLLAVAPASAQWQTQNHSVPIGKGSGQQGFSKAAPGTAGQPLVSTGPSSDPAFGTLSNSAFAAGAANTYKGSLNGTTVVDVAIPPCTAVNQAIRYAAGVGPNCGNVLTLTGYDMPINAGLTSSAVGGALTVTLTTASGGVPSASDPVLVPFRSLTGPSGTVTWTTTTSTLTVTVPSGATLGTSDGVPFRVWLFIAYNSGSPQLGVATCSNATGLFPCASWESTLKTSIAINTASDVAGTLYTPAGVTLDAVRIIGHCDYGSGLATAGTWTSACTFLQPFGPGVKKPGDTVQRVFNTTTTQGTVTSASLAPITNGQTASVTPTAAMNPIRVWSSGIGYCGTPSAVFALQHVRGVTPIGVLFAAGQIGAGGSFSATAVMETLDFPNTVASTTYTIYGKQSSGQLAYPGTNGTYTVGAMMTLEEIQG